MVPVTHRAGAVPADPDDVVRLGITVFSGMIASTCLAALFVPTFFVVVQRSENWLAARKEKAAPAQTGAHAGP